MFKHIGNVTCDYVSGVLLGCDVVWSLMWLQTFQLDTSPPSLLLEVGIVISSRTLVIIYSSVLQKRSHSPFGGYIAFSKGLLKNGLKTKMLNSF
jgi:hypothetical protein